MCLPKKESYKEYFYFVLQIRIRMNGRKSIRNTCSYCEYLSKNIFEIHIRIIEKVFDKLLEYISIKFKIFKF